MGKRPVSSVYSLLTGLTTTKGSFDFVAGTLMAIGDTSWVRLDGAALRLVERTSWRVCVMWSLRVFPVVGWLVLAFS